MDDDPRAQSLCTSTESSEPGGQAGDHGPCQPRGRRDDLDGRFVPMSMNIKSPEAHELARQLAACEDTTVTNAVTISLREALARRRADQVTQSRLEKMRQLADTFARLERQDEQRKSLWELNAELYDEQGLPR